MAGFEFGNNYSEELLLRSEQALTDAVAIVSPETPDAKPLEVFPAPGERRADDPGLALSPDQETALRAAAAELGFGRETDRTLSELGLQGARVIIEGGQPHKVMAEAKLVTEDAETSPAMFIFSGSMRPITNPAEQASAERLGVTADTEYEMVRRVAESLDGFTPHLADTNLRISYDIENQFAIGHDSAGQFIHIGSLNGADVLLMRIDNKPYIDLGHDTSGLQPPRTADVMKIVHEVALLDGDDSAPIAYVSSATYQPSREVDGALVSLQTGRFIGIPTYGTARLAEVKGEAVPAPAPINQLPGEFHKMALEVAKLRQALHGK